jgi:hypothetical protein
MWQDKNYELFAKKARLIVNRQDDNDKALGQALVFLYEMIDRENERDAREEANKAQWGDETSEKRSDIIGQNGNDGLHY